MSELKAGPRLVPLTVTLIVVLWLFVTTGWRQVLVKEVLSSAYDSQAEHFLRGDVGVDVEDIRHESMIVDGKARMYFGPFPAFLRIPLNFFYPRARGTWSRISGFGAAVIALVAFAGLLRDALRRSALPRWSRDLIANSALLGIAFASPLPLLLGNLSIYHEAIIWGFAGSTAALFFAYRAWNAGDSVSLGTLLGFSVSAVAALLSRVTFGLPLLLAAPLFLPRLWRTRKFAHLAALCLPLAVGLVFYAGLSYARFGSFTGVDFRRYINPAYRNFLEQHHIFELDRVPTGIADYCGLRFPPVEHQLPYFRGERYHHHYGSLYALDLSETYVSLLWASTWLIFGALIGAYLLFTRHVQVFDRILVAACAVEALLILSFYALAQRYAADLYPLLIVSFLVFVRVNGELLRRTQYMIVLLVIVSAIINSLTTISWLINSDLNVPPETKATWRAFLGR